MNRTLPTLPYERLPNEKLNIWQLLYKHPFRRWAPLMQIWRTSRKRLCNPVSDVPRSRELTTPNQIKLPGMISGVFSN